MSLKTNSNIKKKLFDASIWICSAAIFEPWAILFFLLLFFGMGYYSVTQIKNILIPFCGILVVGFFLISYQLLTENTLPNFSEYLPSVNFDKDSFNNKIIQTESLQFLAIVLFGFASFIVNAVLKNRLNQPSSWVLILAILIAITIVFITPNHSLGLYLFAFAPSSIVLANFSETTKYPWVSELVIGCLLFAVLLQMSLNISILIN
jgi:hypothetical protein